ncbi:MAG TPA: efflux RND transporter permease subunit [Isosphaeraceae bacterium]|nr:efflux RND transporter permease subunit [Isosphaeraceae bacterium]
MIDAIITFSTRHRFLVIGASLVLAALGGWAAWDTPVDAIPDLSENQVIVFTEWKGHGPREIEDQVTYPMTLGLRGLRGVRVVRSSSDVGFSMISVIFEDGVPIVEARRRVAERMARLGGQLPQGAAPELAPDAPATGQIFWYTVEGGGLDLGRLRAIQDWYVRPQLGSVPGVADVSSVGGFPIEYQVAPDPDRLSIFGVTLADLVQAIAASNAATGGHVLHKGNAEYVVRGVGWLGASPRPGDESFDPRRAVRDLENVVLPARGGGTIRLAEVAEVTIGPGFRRGVLEKDGNEVTGGVVLMAHGENPLEVTRRLKAKIRELQAGLPRGVRIVPFYDRTPLIEGAVATVRNTVLEAMASASLCVLLVLLHVRTSLVIAATLPLAALSSFLVMALLRHTGVVDIQANAMSLAGIAISIGVLVDSSVVMAENVMHRLREHFGDQVVRGDVRAVVLPACLAVGRPIVFSVAIMVLSFLPVFALGGIEGKMFHPLASTKTFALASVAVLAITLVPALCTLLIRGRLRSEQENPLVRVVIEVYRPVLLYLMDHPAILAGILGVTFLLGFAPLGSRPILLGTLLLAMVATAVLARSRLGAVAGPAAMLVAALAAESSMTPLEHEFMTPLDEGMVMDMPITVPRASVVEAVDDLKARDMILCRFPEVDMVVGKAGRAETPTDPAPMDMIETMVNFRPRAFWPRRKLRTSDAQRQVVAVLDALLSRRVIEPPVDGTARDALVDQAVGAALARFDAASREYAYHRNQELVRESGGVSPSALEPSDPAEARLVPLWRRHVDQLDNELLARAAPLFTRLALEELLERARILDPAVAAHRAAAARLRAAAVDAATHPRVSPSPGHHHHAARSASTPLLEPQPALEAIQDELARRFGRWLLLWQAGRDELTRFGGEMDAAVSMPGWTNVWTMPIQNRVDMLATGVNTPIGIRVLGRSLEDVVRGSEEVARVVKGLPGAVDVVADPIRGKPYIEVRLDRERAARLGVGAGEVNEVIETAMGGKVVTTTVEGRERHPVVVRYGRSRRQDEDSVRNLLVMAHGTGHGAGLPGGGPHPVPLAEVAEIRVVEGPATIKSENGLLRNYVRLSARGRDAAELVEEAKTAVARDAKLPSGVFLEWTGQFEHAIRARRTLTLVVPIVVVLIFLILYWTYHDLADAALMMLAVPGAIAGGLFFQWLLGWKLSVTVWVGYIACFGMATSTGIIMLVYLREAVTRAGGLDRISRGALRQAVVDGAVHRLRPKLLTEGTVVIGLVPLLWSTGVASEIIRPMAAPVLGGILVADEVIDLFLPIVFYWVRYRRWQRLHARGQDAAVHSQPIPEP